MADIRMNTDRVLEVAGTLQELNEKLTLEFSSSSDDMKSLDNNWKGEAKEATLRNFNGVYEKYVKDYEPRIEEYVKFLKARVAEGYFQTEVNNINMAESFK